MSKAPLIATSALVGAALGALVASFVPTVREGELEARVSDLEDELAAVRRDSSDWERVALAEQERKRIVEEENRALRIALDQLPPPPQSEDTGDAEGGMAGGHGMQEPRGRVNLPPEEWDHQRFGLELQRLAMRGRRMAQSPLLDACAAAARNLGDEALNTLVGALRESGLPANVRLAATMVLERVGDERAVPALLETLPEAREPAQQRAILRALANLPGDAQTQAFVDLWNAGDSDGSVRVVAAHALARRGHALAVAIVDGSEPVLDPAIRARAIDSLHGFVRDDAYRRTDLIPAFGKALTTAAGEGQLRFSLLALEGYWHPDVIPYLRALEGAQNVPTDAVARAKAAADGIEAKEQRPDDAGLPRGRAPERE
jgi:hypothetical protein